jgi:hypothetical protein
MIVCCICYDLFWLSSFITSIYCFLFISSTPVAIVFICPFLLFLPQFDTAS